MIEEKNKPNKILRLLLLLFIVGFASIDKNPIIRLESIIGLSPSPIERMFGVKSLFSGMSEGVFQLLNFNLIAAINANILSPFVFFLFGYIVLTWNFPKVDTQKKEITFFCVVVGLSLLVNIVNL